MNGRPGRLLAVALLLALAAGAWVLAVRPLLQWRAEARARLDEAAATLVRHRAVAARADEIAAETAALRDLAEREALFLPGASEGQAAAALQDAIKAAMASAGARADSVQALDAIAEGALTTVAMRVRLSADTQALQRLLHALEAGRPILLVDGLYVRARTVRADAAERNLDVRLDVVGFAQTGGRG
jgi:general secretion pathway protein M